MLISHLEIDGRHRPHSSTSRSYTAGTRGSDRDLYRRRWIDLRHYFRDETLSPATRVVGVETEGADSMYQSRRAGAIVELPAITSIAETLGARKTQPVQFEIVSRHAFDLVTVSDDSAIQALLDILDKEKLLTEPATSCSVAALVEGGIAIRPGENVVVLSGANIALENVRRWAAADRRDGW